VKVSVIINPRAGSVREDLLRKKISEALFRCDLHFHCAETPDSLEKFISKEVAAHTDALIVCGGDGTVNLSLQTLMQLRGKKVKLPALCLVKSGTANDLAHEMGVSKKIDVAARLILEGLEKEIDIVEISSGSETKYMVTNGGFGIPAITADAANRLRSTLQDMSKNSDDSYLAQQASQFLYQGIKKAGSLIYLGLLLKTMATWSDHSWELEIEIPGRRSFSSNAPFVFVNNQAVLGEKFTTGPATSNSDGVFNLLLVESQKIWVHAKKLIEVYRGGLREDSDVRSFEIRECVIRMKNSARALTYFGDGEVLFRDVSELHLKCLPRALRIMVSE
jgi:diacylglycerol kinase family enzyme